MFTIINFWINFTFVFVQSHETNGLRARIRNVRIANGYQHNRLKWILYTNSLLRRGGNVSNERSNEP